MSRRLQDDTLLPPLLPLALAAAVVLLLLVGCSLPKSDNPYRECVINGKKRIVTEWQFKHRRECHREQK